MGKGKWHECVKFIQATKPLEQKRPLTLCSSLTTLLNPFRVTIHPISIPKPATPSDNSHGSQSLLGGGRLSTPTPQSVSNTPYSKFYHTTDRHILSYILLLPPSHCPPHSPIYTHHPISLQLLYPDSPRNARWSSSHALSFRTPCALNKFRAQGVGSDSLEPGRRSGPASADAWSSDGHAGPVRDQPLYRTTGT